VAQKHTNESYPTLYLYVEPARTANIPEVKVQEMIRQSFSARFSDYNDMKEMLSIEPVIVKLIPCGAFTAYMKSKMEAGADLAHLKPPHMKPSDEILNTLLTVPNG
jgi:hypothetical protein